MNPNEEILKIAFVDKKADYIVITSRRQQIQIEAASYGVEKGWLRQEVVEPDEQSTAWLFYLTDLGREHFGLQKGDNYE